MQGLFSLLLFAVFFFFMMRFGCGAHMVHGNQGGHEGDGVPAAEDPVCGMPVGPGAGYAKMLNGRQYRFCSRNCLEQFDREPERFLSGKGVAR